MKARRILRGFLLIAVSLAAACLSPSRDLQGVVAPETATLVVDAHDFGGRSAALQELPRRPTLVIHPARPLDAKNQPVMLFEGGYDATLAHALTHTPLASTASERRVQCRVEYHADGSVTVAPIAALRGGASYELALAGFARFRDGTKPSPDGSALHAALTVSADASAGASVTSTFPAADSAGVPTNLRFCAITFDGAVSHESAGVWLEDANGVAVSCSVLRFPCDELDATAADCIALLPDAPLQPLARYTLRSGTALRDAHGAALDATSTSFTTAATPDMEPPRFQAQPCARDEQAFELGCALVDDTHVTLRAQADEPVRFILDDGTRSDALLAAHGALDWTRADLLPGQRVDVAITVIDEAGNTTHTTFATTTELGLATLSITEVRADPLGPEPAQEFVELANYGASAVTLAGFTLSDSGGDAGRAITSRTVVYPDARVLLVPDAFDASSPLDSAPSLGTELVRVGPSLGRAGLSNAGEAIYLRDPAGRRVSAAPATPHPKPGICIERSIDNPRSGEPGSFSYDAGGACTPGR